MDTTDLVKKIDSAMEDLPEEARAFLFDGEFAAILEPYKSKFPDQEKFFGIKNKILEFTLGIISTEDLKSFIDQNTPDKEIATNIKRDIQEKVINELLTIIDVHKEMEEGGVENKKTIDEPKKDVLHRMNQSFTAPATITPVKRTYTDLPSTPTTSSGPKPLSEAIPASTPAKPTIDPYRVDPTQE